MRENEEPLPENEALQRILLNNLPAGVIIVDPVTRKWHNKELSMNLQAPHDLSELTQLRQRVKDLEMQLDKQHADSEHFKWRYEQDLLAILNASTETISLIDPGGTILIANNAMARHLQKPVEEIAGRNLSELFPSDVALRRMINVQQVVETGKPVSLEDQRKHSIFKSHFYPVFDKTGHVSRVAVFAMDITQHKQMESILQARLRLSEAVALLPLEGLLQIVLDEAEALTGSCIGFFHFFEKDQQTISLQTWSSNTLQFFCSAEGKGLHYSVDVSGVWADCIRQKRPIIHNAYAELPHRKGMPVGHAQVIRELVVPIFRGEQIVAVFGVGNKEQEYDQRDIELISTLGDMAWDIVLRKQAEVTIRESEERYRLLYESSLDAILLTAPDGRIFSANSSACRMFERTEDEIKQIGRSGVLDSSDPRFALALEERKRTGKFNGELTFIRKSGARFPGEISSSVFKDIDGNLRTSMIIRDITDRKRVEAEKAELETQNRQLQKAKSLGRMAGAIAHHFNNQLQVVMGNLEMAMHDLPRGAQTLEPLTEAMKAARKAAEVSALMLTYRGQTPGKQAHLDLSEACRQNLPLLQATAPKDMILNADIPFPGPVIRANASQIQQVLTHLVTNAWEAAGEKQGSINLTVKTVSQMHIPASKRFPIDWQPQESVYACLEVADTGCGIPDSCIEKIFDPFFTTKFTGRGLGLPVVLGIVGSHGGGVTVESRPGQGRVFRVFLPVSAEAVPIPPEKAVKARETEGGGTVLVVEDEAQVRNMVKMMLTHLGFTVLEARDGIEAVEVFRQHRDKICCVVCDLTMPRMNGWETMAALRSLSPGIPVVLTSGYDEERVMAGDHTELPQAFLGKPYQLKELRETIQKTIGETTAARIFPIRRH